MSANWNIWQSVKISCLQKNPVLQYSEDPILIFQISQQPPSSGLIEPPPLLMFISLWYFINLSFLNTSFDKEKNQKNLPTLLFTSTNQFCFTLCLFEIVRLPFYKNVKNHCGLKLKINISWNANNSSIHILLCYGEKH